MLFMGKFTISTGPFSIANCYCSLPEGTLKIIVLGVDNRFEDRIPRKLYPKSNGSSSKISQRNYRFGVSIEITPNIDSGYQ